METVGKILGDVELWKITAPVLTVVIGWLLNERARRRVERERRMLQQQKGKRVSYRKLLENSKGFNDGQPDATVLKQRFLDELQLCWLHAPDDVIQRAYVFLDSVHTGHVASDADRKNAIAELVAAMRNDTLSHKLVTKSGMRAADYRLLKAT